MVRPEVHVLLTFFFVFGLWLSVVTRRYPHGAMLSQLWPTAAKPAAARPCLVNCSRIVYNKVPKCGSTTMDGILRTTARMNNFSFVQVTNGQFAMSKKQRRLYLKKMAAARSRRLVVSGHHYFFDFNKCSLGATLHFINIIRQPVSWFVSAYSYFSTQSSHFMNRWWNSRPMEQCINEARCVDYILRTFGAVRFLCGNSAVCNNTRSSDALQLAKRHVDENYLLICITEQMDNCIRLLELMVPNLFRRMWSGGILKRRRITQIKQRLTENATQSLLPLLRYETELYHYVKQRFENVKQMLLE